MEFRKDLTEALQVVACPNVKLLGLHMHIGSQITEMKVFEELCAKMNTFQKWFEQRDINVEHINMGGGLAIDYEKPLENPISPFELYFETIHKNLEVRKGQKVHFEPGRTLVGQCGFLISRVLFVKKGKGKEFVILDSGMNDLIRPALYGARHVMYNLTSESSKRKTYDVVGPVCESSDRFDGAVKIRKRYVGSFGHFSAGAYGQVMAGYNQKELAQAYYSSGVIGMLLKIYPTTSGPLGSDSCICPAKGAL